MNNVLQTIKNKLGADRAKMYANSASMFNAAIESSVFAGAYFVESSQFVGSDNVAMPREYHLKVIGSHVSKVLDFKNKQQSIDFVNSAMGRKESLNSGALVIERGFISREIYDNQHVNKNHSQRYYDNGYTALYGTKYNGFLFSYCEGDLMQAHCATDEIYDREVKNHVDFYNENEGWYYECIYF